MLLHFLDDIVWKMVLRIQQYLTLSRDEEPEGSWYQMYIHWVELGSLGYCTWRNKAVAGIRRNETCSYCCKVF